MSNNNSDDSLQDEKLVNFLKIYSTSIPQERKPCEELVMRMISTENCLHRHKLGDRSLPWLRRSWLLSASILTVIMVIGGYVFNLNSQSSNPQLAKESEDLEAFMVNSWYGSMAQEAEPHLVSESGGF